MERVIYLKMTVNWEDYDNVYDEFIAIDALAPLEKHLPDGVTIEVISRRRDMVKRYSVVDKHDEDGNCWSDLKENKIGDVVLYKDIKELQSFNAEMLEFMYEIVGMKKLSNDACADYADIKALGFIRRAEEVKP